jgi:hypothetical protein
LNLESVPYNQGYAGIFSEATRTARQVSARSITTLIPLSFSLKSAFWIRMESERLEVWVRGTLAFGWHVWRICCGTVDVKEGEKAQEAALR